MKIGFFELEGWENKTLQENFPKDELFFSKDKLEPLNVPLQKDFDVICIFVNSVLSKEVLNQFPNLKLVATRSTGFDHIDIAYCKEKGIKVAYVPNYGMNTVAEFAFGLILNLTRKLYQSIDQIKENGSFSLEGMRGMDIKGKTFGVIGMGKIGRESARIAKGFGMNVIAFDAFPDAQAAAEIGIIAKCAAKKKYIGICGQAPSDYPEFAEFLVEKGIESISLNPDTVIKNILKISEKEKDAFL